MILKRAKTLSRVTIIIALALLAILVAIPYLFPGNQLLLTIFVLANVWAILAMSWDLLSGYTGQISFGHSFFFGIGGFTSALLGLNLGWSPLFTIPIAGIMAAVGGLLIAAPALRLRGPYLSLITLVSALGIEQLIRFLKIGSTGAEGAIQCEYDFVNFTPPKCVPGISDNPIEVYYLSLGLMVLIAVALMLLVRTRVGLAFEAIRDDEEAAAAAGINPAKFKILAFAISGFIAGLAGAFLVHTLKQASPRQVLSLDVSMEAIVASV